jgi:hypothetical protein
MKYTIIYCFLIIIIGCKEKEQSESINVINSTKNNNTEIVIPNIRSINNLNWIKIFDLAIGETNKRRMNSEFEIEHLKFTVGRYEVNSNTNELGYIKLDSEYLENDNLLNYCTEKLSKYFEQNGYHEEYVEQINPDSIVQNEFDSNFRKNHILENTNVELNTVDPSLFQNPNPPLEKKYTLDSIELRFRVYKITNLTYNIEYTDNPIYNQRNRYITGTETKRYISLEFQNRFSYEKYMPYN